MALHHRVLEWLRTADAPLPRFVRRSRRSVARIAARRRHGSITAHMEAVVDEANRGVVGDALPSRHRPPGHRPRDADHPGTLGRGARR